MERAENARPTQTTGDAASQATPVQRHDQESAGKKAPSSSGVGKTEKPRRHPDNPVVYFDIAIGGASNSQLVLC